MPESTLEKLQRIDRALLTQVVRREQQSPAFELGEWSVRRLSSRGVMNPDGLWLFQGQGRDHRGLRPWAVVLKLLFRPDQEPAPNDMWYWKRELLLAQSGLTERLPGPVKAPYFYHTEETPEGAWIWMELVADQRPGAWALEDFRFAAHQLGHWNGMYLAGTPLPTENWLAREHYRSWLGWMDREQDWQFSLNQQHIPAEVRQRHDRLWNDRESFYTALEALPQVFSHCDSQRRNLFIRQRQDQSKQLIATDWAQCGLVTLGAELIHLVGADCMLLEWPASEIAQLDAVTTESYLAGLREAGWSGNANLVRLGQVLSMAVYFGCIFPGWTAWWCAAENREFAIQIYGVAEEALFWKLLPMLAYTLDCADEARSLMQKLSLP